MLVTIKKQIIDFARQLIDEKLLKEEDSLSVRYEKGMVITRPYADFSNLQDSDILVIKNGDKLEDTQALHMAIYGTRDDVNGIVLSHAVYSVAISENCNKLVAVLDDVAQMIGKTVNVTKTDKVVDILKTLKQKNACFVRNQGLVAVGRTLDEAFTSTLVVEKGAKSYIEATILGGAKPIGAFDAALMRFIYKAKYSKKDQEIKKAEITEAK